MCKNIFRFHATILQQVETQGATHPRPNLVVTVELSFAQSNQTSVQQHVNVALAIDKFACVVCLTCFKKKWTWLESTSASEPGTSFQSFCAKISVFIWVCFWGKSFFYGDWCTFPLWHKASPAQYPGSSFQRNSIKTRQCEWISDCVTDT